MTLREQTQRAEAQKLSALACRADQSKGRARPEEECEIRTAFQRDVDRIVYSKAFRRLKHKTQVFLQPEGDHYRTRMTHTIEVSRIARTIARALSLNEDLTEAIALGHDLANSSCLNENHCCHMSKQWFSFIYISVGVYWRAEAFFSAIAYASR